MFEVFLFNVTVGGLIASMIGLIIIEASKEFSKRYKIVRKKERYVCKNTRKNEIKGLNHKIKIAKNNGIIDIKITKSKNGVA